MRLSSLSSWFGLIIVALALPARAVDPPVVAPGECLYLIGAPPGEPAATTEVTGSGTRIYDVCDTAAFAEVGRDAPHRIHLWAVNGLAGSDSRGCRFEGYSEHEFNVGGSTPTWVTISASGSVTGLLRNSSVSTNQVPLVVTLQLRAISVSATGDTVLQTTEVLRHAPGSLLGELNIDDNWSGSLRVLVRSGERLKVRLVLTVEIAGRYQVLDLGAPGSGFGAHYDSLLACTIPLGEATSEGLATCEVEENLHEKRCLPCLWLPAAQGGHLEEAMSHVFARIAQAAASGDVGANMGLAQDRMSRAEGELARREYQRACRSVSDALRALTTP